MRFYCSNPACPRPTGDFDETEFTQFGSALSDEELELFEKLGECPECFLQHHPRPKAPTPVKISEAY